MSSTVISSSFARESKKTHTQRISQDRQWRRWFFFYSLGLFAQRKIRGKRNGGPKNMTTERKFTTSIIYNQPACDRGAHVLFDQSFRVKRGVKYLTSKGKPKNHLPNHCLAFLFPSLWVNKKTWRSVQGLHSRRFELISIHTKKHDHTMQFWATRSEPALSILRWINSTPAHS